MNKMEHLPQEILSYIFSWLDDESRLRLAQTCSIICNSLRGDFQRAKEDTLQYCVTITDESMRETWKIRGKYYSPDGLPSVNQVNLCPSRYTAPECLLLRRASFDFNTHKDVFEYFGDSSHAHFHMEYRHPKYAWGYGSAYSFRTCDGKPNAISWKNLRHQGEVVCAFPDLSGHISGVSWGDTNNHPLFPDSLTEKLIFMKYGIITYSDPRYYALRRAYLCHLPPIFRAIMNE